jgi:hypothetical protein
MAVTRSPQISSQRSRAVCARESGCQRNPENQNQSRRLALLQQVKQKTERKRDEKGDARDGGLVCVGIGGRVRQRGASSGAAERRSASVDGHRERSRPQLLVTQLCLPGAVEACAAAAWRGSPAGRRRRRRQLQYRQGNRRWRHGEQRHRRILGNQRPRLQRLLSAAGCAGAASAWGSAAASIGGSWWPMNVCRAAPRMPKGGPGTWGLSRRYNGARGAVAFLLFPLPKPSVKPNSVSRWSHARFNLRRAYYGQEALRRPPHNNGPWSPSG